MTPTLLVADATLSAAIAASLAEPGIPTSGYADPLVYPCPHCGSAIRSTTALDVEDLRLVGWTPCEVVTYVSPCGHLQSAIPWPLADGRVRLIPVLPHGDLMPGLYVDLRDFVTRHQLCGGPIGEVDTLVDRGHHVWGRCSCGARFERWVAVDPSDAELLRSVFTEPRRSYPHSP
jgi:hypothetical protein